MPVDVVTDVVIERPRDEVAAFAADPSDARAWDENVKAVEWKTPPPLAVGAKVAVVAHFLGLLRAYTYEVTALEPGARLVMRTVEGPFPMETSYVLESAGEGRTKMTLRSRGEPKGFGRVVGPLIAAAMQRANQKDLTRFKQLLEQP